MLLSQVLMQKVLVLALIRMERTQKEIIQLLLDGMLMQKAIRPLHLETILMRKVILLLPQERLRTQKVLIQEQQMIFLTQKAVLQWRPESILMLRDREERLVLLIPMKIKLILITEHMVTPLIRKVMPLLLLEITLIQKVI